MLHSIWDQDDAGAWRFDGWWFLWRGHPYRIRHWRVYRWTEAS